MVPPASFKQDALPDMGGGLASPLGPTPSRAQRGKRLHPCLDSTPVAESLRKAVDKMLRPRARLAGAAAQLQGAVEPIWLLGFSFSPLLNRELIVECILSGVSELPRTAAVHPA